MVVFSSLLVEFEWATGVDVCVDHWEAAGVSRAFLAAHPNGVEWSCAACEDLPEAAASAAEPPGGDDASHELWALCATSVRIKTRSQRAFP